MSESQSKEATQCPVVNNNILIVGNGLEEPPIKKQHDRDLMQLLGVSLRGVLPYAKRELEELVEEQKDDSDPDLKEELDNCAARIQRATQALQHLNDSRHTIDGVEEDAFDDTFGIVFEDDE